MVRILIVAPPSTSMLKALMAEEGYDVSFTSDGEDGLRVGLEYHPDILICDHNLPSLTGRDLAERLVQARGCADNPLRIIGIAQHKCDQPYATETLGWPWNFGPLYNCVLKYFPRDKTDS
jgi:CheY-like chemotaxis protein